jgi:hypothetical protein
MKGERTLLDSIPQEVIGYLRTALDDAIVGDKSTRREARRTVNSRPAVNSWAEDIRDAYVVFDRLGKGGIPKEIIWRKVLETRLELEQWAERYVKEHFGDE